MDLLRFSMNLSPTKKKDKHFNFLGKSCEKRIHIIQTTIHWLYLGWIRYEFIENLLKIQERLSLCHQ